jgi:tetratricopeptide (TPR) repeat protein
VDESTPEGLFLAGERLEKARDLGPALERYLACVDKEPFHVRALSRAAELYARRGEPVTALSYARRAVETSMYDPEANFVYGIIARRQGDLVDAKEALGWAARSMEYRSAAYAQMAEIALIEKDDAAALEYAGKALDSNSLNLSARELSAVALRKLGRKPAARAVLDDVLEIDPLDHLARFERCLLDGEDSAIRDFKSMIRGELPHETYLETALRYASWGADADAAALLRIAPEQPEVLCWLAWLLRESAPAEAEAFLDKALRMSPELVFPFREESIPVFAHALATRPGDWKPKYYLGLLYWGKGRDDEARDLFAMCGNPDFGPFYLSRAAINRTLAPEEALKDYGRAVEIAGGDWRSWHGLIDWERTLGRTAQALEHARKATGLLPDNLPLRIDLVKTLMAADLTAEAAGVLDGVEALPFEGASEIHELFVRAHVSLGLESLRAGNWAAAIDSLEHSKLYPEKLGTGAPYEPDVRLQDYFEMLAFRKLGDSARADAARKAILAYSVRNPAGTGPGAWFGGLVLRQEGDKNRARDMLEKASPPDEAIRKILRTLE